MDKPMTFNEWLDTQGNMVLLHANCCRIAYEAGQQSQQTKVDELERIIKLRDQQLTEEIALSTKYVGKFDELQKRVDALTLALDQIAYPIPHMQKEAELNGCELNGYWAVKMSEDHTYSKDIARRALEKEQALKGEG